MSPARAVFRAKSVVLAATLHMEAAEVVSAAIRLAVDYAAELGTNRHSLHGLLDDALAQAAIEGARRE